MPSSAFEQRSASLWHAAARWTSPHTSSRRHPSRSLLTVRLEFRRSSPTHPIARRASGRRCSSTDDFGRSFARGRDATPNPYGPIAGSRRSRSERPTSPLAAVRRSVRLRPSASLTLTRSIGPTCPDASSRPQKVRFGGVGGGVNAAHPARRRLRSVSRSTLSRVAPPCGRSGPTLTLGRPATRPAARMVANGVSVRRHVRSILTSAASLAEVVTAVRDGMPCSSSWSAGRMSETQAGECISAWPARQFRRATCRGTVLRRWRESLTEPSTLAPTASQSASSARASQGPVASKQ
jgi:hypothetical protein